MDTGDAGTPGLNDLEGAKFCGGDIKVLPCRYTDVRLGASESLLKENVFSSVPTTFGAPDTDVSAFKMEPMATRCCCCVSCVDEDLLLQQDVC